MDKSTERICKTITGERTLHPQNIDEAIKRWDDGESLFTVEMGGMGPGYEQAIQVTFMELLRMRDQWFGIDDDRLNDTMNECMWANDEIKKLRLSGAQAGAAKNLACHFTRQGWEETLKTIDDDRHIQISKGFPA